MTVLSKTATQNLENLGSDLGPDFRTQEGQHHKFFFVAFFKKMLKIIFENFEPL